MQANQPDTLKWDLEAGGYSILFGLAVLVLTIIIQEVIMLASGLGPFDYGGTIVWIIPAWGMLIALVIAAFLISGACLPLFDRLVKRWGKLGYVTLEGTKLQIHESKVHEFNLLRPMTIEASWHVMAYKDALNERDPISTMVHVELKQDSLHVTILSLAEFREFTGFKMPRIQEAPNRDMESSGNAVSMNFDSLGQMLFEVSKRRL